jgi:small subunit ribosomal protein S17
MKRRARGIVTSDKMDKTIAVSVERVRQHPRYKKYMRQDTRLKAHDSHNTAHEGDLVEVEETRPLSKTKSWRLVRVLRRSAELRPIEEDAEQLGAAE